MLCGTTETEEAEGDMLSHRLGIKWTIVLNGKHKEMEEFQVPGNKCRDE